MQIVHPYFLFDGFVRTLCLRHSRMIPLSSHVFSAKAKMLVALNEVTRKCAFDNLIWPTFDTFIWPTLG